MNRKQFNIATGMLFATLFVYLLLRAWLVEPLKDELMTYYFFVERGTIIDDVIIGDEANNHLLNSFLAHFFNSFDNGNFFLMRLPNLLAFPLFFLGIVKLIRGSGNNWQDLVLISAAVYVPFYLEYFAACRGYGMALTGMAWMLFFTRKWIAAPQTTTLLLLYISAWLMVFANLGYLILAIICIAITVSYQLIVAKTLSGKKQLLFASLHALFILSLLPFVHLANELREAGALYYGSLDGFWQVTVKSILRYTVFFEENWLKYILGAGFAALLLLAVRNLLKEKPARFYRRPETVYLLFLAGNVAAILFLAKFRNVNYPEDRVAMHLVLLAILLTGTMLLRSRLPGSIAVFALFPLLFLTRINLDSSVISPDDRMNTGLYKLAKSGLGEFSTVGGYHTLPLMWAWNERDYSGKHVEMQVAERFHPYFDYLFTREDLPEKPDSIKNYRLIGSHERSRFKLWKRTSPIGKNLLFTLKSAYPPSGSEYFNLAGIQLADSLRGKPLLTTVSADLKFVSDYEDIFLAYATFKKDGSQSRYEQFNMVYSHGYGRKEIPLRQNLVFPPFESDETELRIYIWNRERANMYFYNGLVKFYELEP